MQALYRFVFLAITTLSFAWLVFDLGRGLLPIHPIPVVAHAGPMTSVSWAQGGDWNVFGKTVEAHVAMSSMPWVIKGIFYANKPEKSTVILLTNSQEEKIYRVGDSIAQGATVQQILVNAVLISRQGQLERLTLPNPVV